jgi:hypothetical protein
VTVRSARTVWAGVAVVAVVVAGCGTTPPPNAHPPHSAGSPAPEGANEGRSTTTSTTGQPVRDATAVTTDEAELSNRYGCGGTCQFEVASTTDGRGGTLYGIEVVSQFGDGYGRGAVFFFRGESLLAGTGSLAPATSVQHGAGLDWVLDPGVAPGISVPSPGQFAVTYVVSSGPDMCNACDGDDGTDTFVYRWNGSAMALESGTSPTPPAVIGDGTQ